MRSRRTPLELVALGMAVAAVVFAAAMVLDPRTVEGWPAWLKPAKFAASTAIYSATLAWMFRYLPDWPRLTRRVGALTAAIFAGEVALIALQAARGETSHFNTSSAFNGIVFTLMGLGIFTQTVAAIAVTVALWRQRVADRALGWALRLGMTLTVVGASVGGMMTQPTTAQLTHARTVGAMPRSGQHSVGGVDGGAGLPGTGWSTEHGDLRVPHFVGLHAMQALPIVALLLPRRRDETTRVRLVWLAAVSYAALFALLLVQAMSGQPLVALSSATLTAVGAWAATTTLAATAVWRRGAPASFVGPSSVEAA
jgi:hypothetical protein